VAAGASGASPLGAAPPPAGGIDLAVPGDGVRLAATRWPGDGTPIVLLHGLASQRRFWNLVAPLLAGLPVLALDQRGHGDSDRPADGYDATVVTRDLAIAMDAVGWSRAVVVGHSWGGMVAATFAAEYPHRSLALVAIDGGFGSPMTPDVSRAEVRERLKPPRLEMPPGDLEEMLRSHLPAGRAWDELRTAVLPIFEVGADGLARARLPFDTHMQIVETLLDYDAEATLSRVRCPAWLVSCEGPGAEEWSRLKARALDALSGRLAAGRVMRWGGAIHDVPLQWPPLVAGLIRTAVTDAAATGGAAS
jgi:pimeloyl-ACP methyl ester carboxylesterase